jgi:hypothetical protein
MNSQPTIHHGNLRSALLFLGLANLGNAHEKHTQADEEDAETDRATPVECEPHVHDFSPFV